jgi:CheY-like chemotaxis protein
MSEDRPALTDRLVAGVAHDLNNILGAVLAAAQAISARPGVDAETRADLSDLASAARRGGALVRHLLASVRDTPSLPRRLELRTALEELRGLLRHAVGRHVTLALDVAGDPAVWLDPVHFDQILLNLAANARDAMTDGGTLRISCAAEGNEAVLAVRDDGRGMSEEIQVRIFEPFFTSGKTHGTGIGLATVAAILAGAGGRIEVRSRPGEGTCMTIRLPLLAPGEAIPPASPAVSSQGAVLLVEDEELPRRLAARVLAARGWQPHPAATCEEAKTIAGRESLTAVIADLELPDGDGAALVAALRGRPGQAGLAAVIVSGHAPEQMARFPEVAALLESAPGRTLLLGKPYTPDELAGTVSRIAEAASCRGELTNIK